MSEPRYQVIFKGEILEGKEIQQVKANLAKLLKSNPAKIEKLFAGKSVVIKKGITQEFAVKIQKAFEKAGAQCQVIQLEVRSANKTEKKEEPQEVLSDDQKTKSEYKKRKNILYLDTTNKRISLVISVLTIFIILFSVKNFQNGFNLPDLMEYLYFQGIIEADSEKLIQIAKKYDVNKNYTESLKWYLKAAELGNAEAQYQLGEKFYKSANFHEALKWYHKSAQQGYVLAQSKLGAMYEDGIGVAKDEKEAVTWYRKAAEQGLAEAQFGLGRMYKEGSGVAKDEKEAVRWYRKAAEQGYALAQEMLGFMYANGRGGVAKDEKQAVRWYIKAAEQGLVYAQFFLGSIYSDGSGVAKDEKEAVRWYRKAAEQGLAEAQILLGSMYANGSGVATDEKEAGTWYRKAAEQGYALAQERVGFMYANGRGGVVKDENEAVRWYRKAAEQGNFDAIRWVEKNNETVNYGLHKAADQGDNGQKVTIALFNDPLLHRENGLIWQKQNHKRLIWDDAMKYCDSLNLGGYSDWRLPN